MKTKEHNTVKYLNFHMLNSCIWSPWCVSVGVKHYRTAIVAIFTDTALTSLWKELLIKCHLPLSQVGMLSQHEPLLWTDNTITWTSGYQITDDHASWNPEFLLSNFSAFGKRSTLGHLFDQKTILWWITGIYSWMERTSNSPPGLVCSLWNMDISHKKLWY